MGTSFDLEDIADHFGAGVAASDCVDACHDIGAHTGDGSSACRW